MVPAGTVDGGSDHLDHRRAIPGQEGEEWKDSLLRLAAGHETLADALHLLPGLRLAPLQGLHRFAFQLIQMPLDMATGLPDGGPEGRVHGGDGLAHTLEDLLHALAGL